MLNTRQSGIDPLECSPSNKMETPESCPAVLLPYEILGVIFSYNLPSVHKLHSVEDFDGEFEALRLSHVYRRWRLVCHEMPHLWQTIAILDIEEEEAKDGGYWKRCCARTAHYIQLSKDLPLRVVLNSILSWRRTLDFDSNESIADILSMLADEPFVWYTCMRIFTEITWRQFSLSSLGRVCP
ncbi:hypothetical protein D9757_013227 [Collybiopsis confluens]|uniref:F-box domain-containing protein n=1 Tax=Collybiopsis confluens TaxID=2823264 RepID=A0A8H5GA65_9AGAR|nr:hypothetical protein D9757_013227 [Collybiopsis confluens]